MILIYNLPLSGAPQLILYRYINRPHVYFASNVINITFCPCFWCPFLSEPPCLELIPHTCLAGPGEPRAGGRERGCRKRGRGRHKAHACSRGVAGPSAPAAPSPGRAAARGGTTVQAAPLTPQVRLRARPHSARAWPNPLEQPCSATPRRSPLGGCSASALCSGRVQWGATAGTRWGWEPGAARRQLLPKGPAWRGSAGDRGGGALWRQQERPGRPEVREGPGGPKRPSSCRDAGGASERSSCPPAPAPQWGERSACWELSQVCPWGQLAQGLAPLVMGLEAPQ